MIESGFSIRGKGIRAFFDHAERELDLAAGLVRNAEELGIALRRVHVADVEERAVVIHVQEDLAASRDIAAVEVASPRPLRDERRLGLVLGGDADRAHEGRDRKPEAAVQRDDLPV